MQLDFTKFPHLIGLTDKDVNTLQKLADGDYSSTREAEIYARKLAQRILKRVKLIGLNPAIIWASAEDSEAAGYLGFEYASEEYGPPTAPNDVPSDVPSYIAEYSGGWLILDPTKLDEIVADLKANEINFTVLPQAPDFWNVYESISKKQLRPVVQSFKAIATETRPDNDLQTAMGPETWELQVGQASQDFENYLSRISNRILGRLKNGEYAPTSALNFKKRAMDVDAEKKELSKVGSKATRNINKLLGVQ